MDADELLNRYATGERNFREVDLGSADLSWDDLSGADLRDAYLSDADLSYAKLSGADLRDAYLSYANLIGANLRYSNLRGAKLSGTDLRGADLRDADLRDANLSRAKLSRADLSVTNLRGANLIEVNLSKLKLVQANLSRANLAYANFNGSDLRNADLSDANLAGTDFINRLNYDSALQKDLLKCKLSGCHSELVYIYGNELKQLRDFCWDMAEKFKQNSPVRNVFINNLKGKLGETVVKKLLADFVTEVDYEKRIGGDGKVDLKLSSNPSVGIQVKARSGSFDKVQWSISQEEVDKNAALVCILIQEEVSEAQTEYHLIMAGFLPTNMIEVKNDEASVKIKQLLYGGGLKSYLESFNQ